MTASWTPTADQGAAFGRAWVERVLARAPLTDTDRAAAAAAILESHRLAGLPAPRAVNWVGSPEGAERWRAGHHDALITRLDLPVPAPSWCRRLGRWSRRSGGVLLRLTSPLLGAWVGALVAMIGLMAYLGAGIWVVLAASVIALIAALRAIPFARMTTHWASALAITVALAWLVMFLGGVLRTFDTVRWWTPPISQPVFDVVVGLGLVTGGVLGAIIGRRGIPPAERRVTWHPHAIVEVQRRMSARIPRVPATVQWAVQEQIGAAAPAILRAGGGWESLPDVATWALSEQSVAAGVWGRRGRRRRRRALATCEAALAVWWSAGVAEGAEGAEVVAIEPPLQVHAESLVGLHRLDGPAVQWADGSLWYCLNGIRVPRRPDSQDWTVEEIHAVENSEARRTMIEAIGWAEYVELADLTLLADAPDPANPPHRLELYELPPHSPDRGQRLLLMTNGSPDRSGVLRRYAEFVPEMFDDPVESVAWQYGVPVEVYRQIQRRT